MLNGTSAQHRIFSAINRRMPEMIFIKSNEYNTTNNYNDKGKNDIKIFEANIK